MPIQFVFFSRVPKTVAWPLFVGVFVLLLGSFVVGEAVRSGTFTVSPSALLPDRPGARSVDARYFATTRDPLSTAPFVQSEIVTGPYLRLEVPLVARRHGERLDELCPEAPPLGESGLVRSGSRREPPEASDMDEVLACVAGLWAVTLDGQPLPDLAWDFRSEPGRGVTAVVAYLATEDLSPGAHVLGITEVPPEKEPREEASGSDEEEPNPRRHLIRFRT